MITVERAIEDQIPAKSLLKVAAWNEAAARLADRRNDKVASQRHLQQAADLTAVAKSMPRRG